MTGDKTKAIVADLTAKSHDCDDGDSLALLTKYSVALLSYRKPEEPSASELKSAESIGKHVAEVVEKTPILKKDARSVAKFAGYPTGAYFCLAFEFVERFSFYGFKAVLILYLVNVLKFESYNAKLTYHSFVSFTYFTSLIGSVMADGYCGKFVIIIVYTVIYCFGYALNIFGVTDDLMGANVGKAFFFLGLFFIACGAGGIKPCVYSFMSDQFPPTMTKQRKHFSNLLYFITAGGMLLSEFVSPLLRQLDCLGHTSCYPLALGVQAGLLFVGLIIVCFGKNYYKVTTFPRYSLLEVIKCTTYALRVAVTQCRRPTLDSAKAQFDPVFVEDVKSLCHILLMFVPTITFWALFDQQGSTWVLQATQMNGHFGLVTLVPGQVQLFNPLFLIILVLIFGFVVYPLLWKYNFLVLPLRRMSYGCVFAVLSFVAAGFVQMLINSSLVQKPQIGTVHVILVNMYHCDLMLSNQSDSRALTIAKGGYLVGDYRQPLIFYKMNCVHENDNDTEPIEIKQTLDQTRGHVIVFWSDCFKPPTETKYKLAKIDKGYSLFRTIFHPNVNESLNDSVSIALTNDAGSRYTLTPAEWQVRLKPDFWGSTNYRVILKRCRANDSVCTRKELKRNFKIENGAVYYLILDDSDAYQLIVAVEPNNVSIAWMVPQFLLITVSEIMFAHSGSEFAYSQASPSMKSTLQSLWLLSIAFGNALDMLIYGINIIHDSALEYFIYAALMAVSTCVFVYLSLHYTYIERDKVSTDTKSKSSKIKKIQSDKSTKRPKLKPGLDWSKSISVGRKKSRQSDSQNNRREKTKSDTTEDVKISLRD